MKKKFFIAISCLLLLILFSPPSAYALATVDMSIEATPDALAQDGYVSLRVALRVSSGLVNQSISEVFLYMDGADTPIAQMASIPAGTEYVFQIDNIFISKIQIDKPITLTLYYKGFSGTQNVVKNSFAIMDGVQATSTEAHLTFARTASASNARVGSTINFTYVLSNDGKVIVKDVVISDELLGQIAIIDQLLPGERKEYVVGRNLLADMTSTPQIHYLNAQTNQRSTFTIEPLTVGVSNPKLTVLLKADNTLVQSGDTVTLTATILNEGNVTFYDVMISDDTLGMLPGTLTLLPGEPYVVSKKVKLVEAADYCFVVAAKNEEGVSTMLKSNVVKVSIKGITDTATTAPDVLFVRAVPDVTILEQAGKVTFTITISNQGTKPITDVVLSEASGGILQKMDTLPTGDKIFYFENELSIDKVFAFSVEGKIDQTMRVQATTQPISIAIQATTPSATPAWQTQTPDPLAVEPTQSVTNAPFKLNGLLLALGVVVLLIAVCIVVLIRVMQKDRATKETYLENQAFDHPNQYHAPVRPQQPPISPPYAPPVAPQSHMPDDQVTQPARHLPHSQEDIPTRPINRQQKKS